MSTLIMASLFISLSLSLSLFISLSLFLSLFHPLLGLFASKRDSLIFKHERSDIDKRKQTPVDVLYFRVIKKHPLTLSVCDLSFVVRVDPVVTFQES